MSWDNITKVICAAGGAIVGWFGGWSAILTLLVAVMAIDYVTGIIVAACGKSTKTEMGGLSSKVGFVGLAKKAVIMLVVLLATVLDKALGGDTMVFQTAAACYYIANEGLSILENTALLGVKYPAKLKAMLETLREKNNGEDGGTAE